MLSFHCVPTSPFRQKYYLDPVPCHSSSECTVCSRQWIKWTPRHNISIPTLSVSRSLIILSSFSRPWTRSVCVLCSTFISACTCRKSGNQCIQIKKKFMKVRLRKDEQDSFPCVWTITTQDGTKAEKTQTVYVTNESHGDTWMRWTRKKTGEHLSKYKYITLVPSQTTQPELELYPEG